MNGQYFVTPVNLPVEGVTLLTMSQSHSCGLSNGNVMCWGRNSEGQLGDGTKTSRFTPAAIAW